MINEIWQYRELLWVFAWRDLKVRYKQTVMGIVWVVFQPVVVTTIFSVIFGKVAKIPSGDLPYPIFAYSGLIFWNLFASELSTLCTSVVSMGGILQKVYFPRIIIPLSSMATPLIDFFVSLIPLVIMFFYFQVFPHILFLPIFIFFVLILLIFVCGLGMFFAALQVKYRDVRYLLNFFLQIGMFVTPVIYPLSAIYDNRKVILALNPLSGIIENFRVLISGSINFDYPILLISIIGASISLVFGAIYYQRKQKEFADVV